MAKKKTTPSLDTREKLLRMAARSFGMQGYSATTMRSIADEAGMEAGSIYYHFASKEELVEAVMAHGGDSIVQHMKERIDALPPSANAEARFRAAVAGQMSALVEFGDYALAHGRLLAQLPENARQSQITRRERHQQLWSGFLDDLKEEGVLREDIDVRLCRVFLLGCINSTQTWFNPAKGSVDQVANQLCALFFDGVKRR